MSVIKYKSFKIAIVKTPKHGVEMYTSAVFLEGKVIAKRTAYSANGAQYMAKLFVNSIAA